MSIDGFRLRSTHPTALLRRLRRRRPALRKILLHSRHNAVLPHLVEPERVDALVLVLVFDLIAALLDVERHRGLLAGFCAKQRTPVLERERIAQPPDAGREIARGLAARIEMLVELPVRRRK